MQLHELRPVYKTKKKKRVGRGGKRGTYSGRGVKGQKARAGAKIRPVLRDFIKKIPKKRGYRFKGRKKEKPQIVNLKDLEKHFKEGGVVNPETLLKKGLVSKIKGDKIPKVKILGQGTVTKRLKIENCSVSKSVANIDLLEIIQKEKPVEKKVIKKEKKEEKREKKEKKKTSPTKQKEQKNKKETVKKKLRKPKSPKKVKK